MKLISTKEKVSKSKRVIALVLFFAMILSLSSSLTAFGIEEKAIMIRPQFVGELAKEDIPFCLDEKVVSDAEHTVRLRYLETEDNVAAFSNPDGSATMYYFSNPIKYTDAYGNTVDIDNTLKVIDEIKSQYKYKTSATPATTYLPETIGAGEDVKVEYKGYTIQIIPVSNKAVSDKVALGNTVESKLKSKKSDGIFYSSVFGRGRSLRYTTLYNGVKEDIILDSYTPDANEFDFLIKTNGLELIEVNGQYLFRDKLGVPMFELSPIFVYDSAEIPNTTDGTYTIKEVKANEIYAVTVTVDDTWLSNATYPVTIDPTYTYSDDVGLEDSFQITGNTLTTGNSSVLYVGKVNGRVARSFFRFPNLHLSTSAFSSIESASLYVKGKSIGSPNATPGIYVEAYNINRAWTENDLPYSLPFDEYYSSPKITGSVTLNNYGAIDITSLVSDWLSSSQASSASKGIILKVSSTNESASSNYYAYIHSSKATNASDRPYLTIKYVEYPIPSTPNTNIRKNRFYWVMDSSGNYAISLDSPSKMASKSYTNLSQRMLFSYAENGRYRISTENAPKSYLSFSGSTLSLASESSSLNQQWYIAETSSGKYCIMNAAKPDYNLTISPSSLGYILYCRNDSPYLWTFEKCPTFYGQHFSTLNGFSYWNSFSSNTSFNLKTFKFKRTINGTTYYSLPFFDQNNEIKDLMDQGCVLSSMAMIMDNLNAKSINLYDDPRTSETTKINLIPDPFTVAWANNNFNPISNNTSISPHISKKDDTTPILAHYELVESFNLSYNTSKSLTGSVINKAQKIKEILDDHKEGVIVRVGKDSSNPNGKHSLVITKYLGDKDPNELDNPSVEDLQRLFVVYDPVARSQERGSGCLWQEAQSIASSSGLSTAMSVHYFE